MTAPYKPMLIVIDPADRGTKDFLALFLSEGPERAPAHGHSSTSGTASPGEPLTSFSSESTTETMAPRAGSVRQSGAARRARMAAVAALAIITIWGLAGSVTRRTSDPRPVGEMRSPVIETRPTEAIAAETSLLSGDLHERIDAEPRPPALLRAVAPIESSDDRPRMSRLTSGTLPSAPIARSYAETSSNAAASAGIDVQITSIAPAAAPASTATSDVEVAAAGRRPAVSTVESPEEALDRETGAIRNVLNRYQRAFNELDASEAKAVWPAVDDKSLVRAFGQLERQDVIFLACQIEVTGVLAVSSCDGQVSYVPKVGNKTRRIDSHVWRFQLRKIAEAGWTIEGVESR